MSNLPMFPRGAFEIIKEPYLEGLQPRWRQLDQRTILVSPSLWDEIVTFIPKAEAPEVA